MSRLPGRPDAELHLYGPVSAHVGYSAGDYWDNAFGDDQLDYSIGVGYTAGEFNFGLKYVDTHGDVKVTSDAFNNEVRVTSS